MDWIKKQSPWFYLGCLAIGVGFLFRFWRITENQFLFYDEGMYLGYNRKFLNLIAANPPKDIHEFFIILGLLIKMALATAKSFWFFLLNLRVFFLSPDSWFFARLVSFVSALATIILTYVFVLRCFGSKRWAFLSVVFLSLLPSHVFYSRLGMQESLSCLLFLSALFLYLRYPGFNPRTVIASILLVLLFMTNYRMIIAPIYLLAIEVYQSFNQQRKPDWVKLLAATGIFGLLIYIVGSLYGGVNRYVTFGWLFHQAQEAKSLQGQVDLLSFLSYPYYVFVLEGFFFALMFFGNIYLMFKKDWPRLLPFFLVLIQMGIFSFAAEKGARYLCVVLPFMAMASAALVDKLWVKQQKQGLVIRLWLVICCLWMGSVSWQLMVAKTAYGQVTQKILTQDAGAKILSTQPLVEQLFASQEDNIQECPKSLGGFTDLSKNQYHNGFVDYYKEGFRYLLIDPQLYISWTRDEQRFHPPLVDFLESIQEHVRPVAVVEHLNGLMLERFVLDHNQHLINSIRFLGQARSKGYGYIKIYDLQQCMFFLQQQALESNQK